MIIIYEKDTTKFTNLGLGVINPTKAIITEELNGIYELELVSAYDKNRKYELLEQSRIIGVETPKGRQHFRIYKVIPTLTEITVNARHIFFDLLDNLILSLNMTDTAKNILSKIQENFVYNTPFNITTDINKTGKVIIEKENPINALLNTDDEQPKFIQVFGGELERDNYNIRIVNNIGTNRGFTIRYGKNLIGLKIDEDFSDICTRLYAYQNGDLVILDSPNINKYPKPKIKVVEFNDGNLREQAQKYLKEIDIPKVNISVDFILLSITKNYSDYKQLENVYIGDIITVYNEILQLNTQAKVIKYTFNCLTKTYENIELGNFLNVLTNTITQIQKTTMRNTAKTNTAINTSEQAVNSSEQAINLSEQAIQKADLSKNTADDVYNLLHQFIRIIDDSLVILDNPNINVAQVVYKFNSNGISKSTTGLNGQFTKILS